MRCFNTGILFSSGERSLTVAARFFGNEKLVSGNVVLQMREGDLLEVKCCTNLDWQAKPVFAQQKFGVKLIQLLQPEDLSDLG